MIGCPLIKDSRMQLKFITFFTLTLLTFKAHAIVYSNPDYECMQSVKKIDAKTLIVYDTHNLVEGLFCRTQKEYKYNCTNETSPGEARYCQLENKPQNTMIYFPGLQISYTGGNDTVAFRAAAIRFRAPFIFTTSAITDVGLSDNCPEYANSIETKLLTQCQQFTTDCRTVKKEFEKKMPYKIYCRPFIKVEGRPTYKY